MSRATRVNFDNISSRQAGERNFVDFHMHVPGQWSVQRGRTIALRD